MELQKELLKKHLKNRGLTKYSMRAEHYGACLDAISEALTIPVVAGQGEQLVCPECGDDSCISKIYNTHECFTCGEKFKAN